MEILKEKVKIGYWNCRGRGNAVRLTLIAANVDFEEKIYNLVSGRAEWFEEDKKNLGLDLPDIPYMIIKNLKMTEHDAIIRQIARLFKSELLGKDPVE